MILPLLCSGIIQDKPLLLLSLQLLCFTVGTMCNYKQQVTVVDLTTSFLSFLTSNTHTNPHIVCKHAHLIIFISSRKQKKPSDCNQKSERVWISMRVREGGRERRKSALIVLFHTLLALQREREGDKQVCCTALSLSPLSLLSVGGAWLMTCKLPATSFTLREKQNLSAALYSSSLSTTSPPPCCFSSSSPPFCCWGQVESRWCRKCLSRWHTMHM